MSLDAQDAGTWLECWYAEQEGALAELLEQLEMAGPSLDALLAESEQDTRALLADLESQAGVCPCCGQPMPTTYQKPTRSGRKRRR